LVRVHPLRAYFVLVYAISLFALIVLGPPSLSSDGRRSPASLVVFPVMVVWVGAVGFALTNLCDGRRGMDDLLRRMARWRVGLDWYAAAVLIPPAAILMVLGVLQLLVSPDFRPNFFVFGIIFGLVAGFFEEIGWSGFAYPRLRRRSGPLKGALVLGVLWGCWHLPVVDALGAASPHGPAWPAFFLAFVAGLTGLRLLIAWVYDHTESVLLAQLMHASSTGCLVVLGAPGVTPAEEALWYALYAAALWLIAGAVRLQGPGFPIGGPPDVRQNTAR
jgi:membrane protease YdiL (CAAX protease family)